MTLSELLRATYPDQPSIVVQVNEESSPFGGVIVQQQNDVPVLIAWGQVPVDLQNPLTVEGDTGFVDQVKHLQLRKSTTLPVGFNVSDLGGNIARVDLAESFLQLIDTPSSYSTKALKLVRVNAGATALEFTEPPVGGLDEVIQAYRSLGSVLYAQTLGMNGTEISTEVDISTGQIQFIAVYLPTAETITGVKWLQQEQGDYTANNNNKVGLYSYSAGTLTLVASCSDDPNLWKTFADDTIGNKAFDSTYDANPGTYFIAILYCRSAAVTGPRLGGNVGFLTTQTHTAASTLDTTNSAKIFGVLAGQTDLPASQVMSGISVWPDAKSIPWLAIY